MLANTDVSRPTKSTDSVILVVEDEPLIRRAAEAELVSKGYPTFVAANASEALAILDANHDISLMVTDISMPGIDGRELARRAQARFPKLQVILATGLDPDPTQPCLLPILSKPYSTEDLVQAINFALGRI